MDEEQKALSREVTYALRQRSKWENRYFLSKQKYQEKYGTLEKKAGKKKTPEKKEKAKKKKVIAPSKKVACDGNVVTGEACSVTGKDRVKAPDTKWEKKTHPTCKTCKKAIQASKKKK